MSMIAGRRLALLLAALTLGAAGAADAAEKVKVGLDLTVSGYHAPWMVAQRKGYFTDQGLDVSIGRGFGSGDTVKRVASGEIDVGFHHTANLIIANSEGAQLRVVMSYLVQELCGAFSAAEDGNVTTAKKLEGQTWGGPKSSGPYTFRISASPSHPGHMSRCRARNRDAHSTASCLERTSYSA